ncbi:hypothetical protein FPZ12_012355 [Amycolatopsis acidicola]|uniref:Uncharacterized protein n=1 Tax=Amycolatopsis acidicola TaxID=2596893 RepID=A0A5N0V6H0_9PSEU|nr:hypothetical protein [Amycolatopsis acidicola]KAA9162029.1 hypothetical protein FPZ12_012355 [Amycolatopsis acidicola]
MTDRLTYDDDLFLRADRVLGIPVVNQSVWRFPERLGPEAVDELARSLAVGRLGRLVVRSRVPGARDRWVRCGAVTPVVRSAPVEPGDVLGWADEQADVELDPELGPPWQLASAPTTDGGELLSLAVSHAVGDGGAHIASIVEAGRNVHIGRQTRLRDDVRDSVAQVVRAARGIRTAVQGRGMVSVPPGTQSSSVREAEPGDEPCRPPLTVLDCDARVWEDAALANGGSGNALLVAIAVEILVASGRVGPDAPVKVSLPVSARGGDDLRANATTGVSVAVDVGPDGHVGDLATIRARSKTAFGSLRSGRVPPVRALEPLVQLLPDALVARLARSSPAPLCLCSNLGTLPKDFTAPTGVPATSVMMRSMTRLVTRSLLRQRGGGLSIWWSRTGDTATLAVLGLDPGHFPDEPTLRRLTTGALDRWGLRATSW